MKNYLTHSACFQMKPMCVKKNMDQTNRYDRLDTISTQIFAFRWMNCWVVKPGAKHPRKMDETLGWTITQRNDTRSDSLPACEERQQYFKVERKTTVISRLQIFFKIIPHPKNMYYSSRVTLIHQSFPVCLVFLSQWKQHTNVFEATQGESLIHTL